MLHIILLILKIIGIILLCVIGIVLSAIFCVLFVPVRYKIRVSREEGEDKPPVVAYLKVTWLLHFINVLVRYPAQVIVRARVLVFTIFRIPGKEKKSKRSSGTTEDSVEKKSPKSVEVSREQGAEDEKHEQSVQSAPKENGTEPTPVTSKEYKAFDDGVDDLVDKETVIQDDENISLFAKLRNIFVKIRQLVDKIKDFFQNIQYTIRGICDKIKAVLDNIQYYREVLESDSFLKSADLCKRELAWLFKKLKPDRCVADLAIGMEDPAVTGEILAVYGILYPLIGQHVRVAGDFECSKMHIEGRMYIRGRIRAFTFLRIAIRIYFNRDMKQLIRLLKKEAV